MKSLDEIKNSIEAQKKLCQEKSYPHFAPQNGICWGCFRQIYEVENGLSLVTGCPYCHRSYCD